MTFLVTNDDGIEAAGLNALVSAARNLGTPVIVAPAGPQSGVSHAVTWKEGVRIEERNPSPFSQPSALNPQTLTFRSYAIHGTPADCTRLGLLRIVPDANWVLSGINHGSNLGADMYYSGTVAAVREAVLHGWPGIAVSHYYKAGENYDWPRASRWVTPILQELLSKPPERGLFYNVNLPHLGPDAPDPKIVWCELDPNPLPLNYRHEEESGLFFAGDYRLRERTPGADVDVCFNGSIAVTAVRML